MVMFLFLVLQVLDKTPPVVIIANKTCVKGTCTLTVNMTDDVGVVAY